MQGTWFWQIAFVLYPPWDFLTNIWDPNRHDHLMVMVASFIWHGLVIMIAMVLQTILMKRYYSNSTLLHDDLDYCDKDNSVQYKPLKTESMEINETNLINESDESEVDFESMKLVKNSLTRNQH